MPERPHNLNLLRTLAAVILAACLLLFVLRTWHWPLMGDAGLMHYIAFLMDRGRLPYRDIVDPNLPTTLLIERAVIHTLGPGSLPWRLFDLLLLAVAGVSILSICKPCGWFPGLFAASLFALIHGRDGLVELGQRDLTLTVFLLLGYALLFKALRAADHTLSGAPHDRPSDIPTRISAASLALITLFGICCGIASTIKPSMLLLAPAVLILIPALRRRTHQPSLALLLAGIIGTAIPLLLVFAWLHRLHIAADFYRTLTRLIPYFLLLGPRSQAHLILHSISSVMLPLVLLWLPIVILKRNWLNWERAALLIAVAFGLASFYLQRKGFPYHRYPSEAFLLILIATDFHAALSPASNSSTSKDTPTFPLRFNANPKTLRLCALTGLAIGVLYIAPAATAHALWQDAQNHEFETLLTADLTRIASQALSQKSSAKPSNLQSLYGPLDSPLSGPLDGQVQCLDMADACIPTLYNLRLTQSTGFLYDCYLLSDEPGPQHLAERDRFRQAFWQAIERTPPRVFIVSSNNCDPATARPTYDYTKLARWPQLDDLLQTRYHLYTERIPPHMVRAGSAASKPLGYRLYLRNDKP